MLVPSYGPLDGALDRLAGYGPGLANGNFSHAPMVAEALCALGRPETVMPWIEGYQARIAASTSDSGRTAGVPIRPAEWRGALGQRRRFAAWSALFAAELRDRAWQEVLDLWAGRLAPGVSATATHGAIRVGHAVRALTVGRSPQRLRELGDVPEFAPVIGLVDLDGDIDRLLAELTELFTRVYLANVSNSPSAIVFVH